MKRLTLLAVLALALQGCFALPTSGPVHETGGDENVTSGGLFSNAKPPQAGESPTDIVQHFLEAMSATPVQTVVARQFLSKAAQRAWDPSQRTIVYDGSSTPVGFLDVRVWLNEANQLDSRGSWRGALPQGQQLSFPMVQEGGEWRIAAAPDALIVPTSWFGQAFAQVTLYFFDPTGQVLVPEPAFVPRGPQLTTTMVQGLLRGPGPGMGRVDRNYLGIPGGRVLSVTVSPDGQADLAIEGGAWPPGSAEHVVDQLAWTLRQQPDIRTFRVTLNGVPLVTSDGRSQFSVTDGADVDPTGFQASATLFGLRGGLLVTGPPGAQVAASGPFAKTSYDATSLSVDLHGTKAAETTRAGSVLIGSLDNGDTRVNQVASNATSLLRPSWDLFDRLWLVDRTKSGARISVVSGQRPHPVRAPGIQGRAVKSFIVSRDGSRFMAVVAGRAGDRLMVSRVLHDDRGHVLRLGRAHRITWDGSEGVDIVDVGWRTPTTVAVALRLTDDLSQIRTVSVNGAPPSDPQLPLTIRGRVAYLATSPVQAQVIYAVTPQGALDITDRSRAQIPLQARTSLITYAG